jgi:hypothetical protein
VLRRLRFSELEFCKYEFCKYEFCKYEFCKYEFCKYEFCKCGSLGMASLLAGTASLLAGTSNAIEVIILFYFLFGSEGDTCSSTANPGALEF